MKNQIIIYVILILFVGGCFSILSTSEYSNGYRTGTISKFSEKGFVWKTFEGELLMGGMRNSTDADGNSSTVANIFEFSLDADHKKGENTQKLADSINLAIDNGLRVKLHYNQERFTNWFSTRGETNYFIDSVIIIRK